MVIVDSGINRIRRSIIDKLLLIGKNKRKSTAKFLYFKEPVSYGNFKMDRIDGQSVYFEESPCAVAWNILKPSELIEIFNKVKNEETYCFYFSDDELCKKTIEPKGKITITRLHDRE